MLCIVFAVEALDARGGDCTIVRGGDCTCEALYATDGVTVVLALALELEDLECAARAVCAVDGLEESGCVLHVFFLSEVRVRVRCRE